MNNLERHPRPFSGLKEIETGVLTAYRNELVARLSCPVCGRQLGQTVSLDTMSSTDGGIFRLTCGAANADHQVNVKHAMPIDSKRHGYVALEHYARKRWVDPCKLLRVLLSWLQSRSW